MCILLGIGYLRSRSMHYLRMGIVFAVTAALAGSAWSAPKLTYEDLWREATRTHHTVQGYPDFTLVHTGGGFIYYYFTKPVHFAHPGVIKRTLIERRGTWSVTETGWSFGPDAAQPAFKRWMAQFVELDRQMREYIERTRRSSP
jgi:hypothetical protein